jgi:hypothetical protein
MVPIIFSTALVNIGVQPTSSRLHLRGTSSEVVRCEMGWESVAPGDKHGMSGLISTHQQLRVPFQSQHQTSDRDRNFAITELLHSFNHRLISTLASTAGTVHLSN